MYLILFIFTREEKAQLSKDCLTYFFTITFTFLLQPTCTSVHTVLYTAFFITFISTI